MRGDEHRTVKFVRQGADQCTDLVDAHRIQSVCRLVKDQDGRPAEKGARKSETLLHAQRIFTGKAFLIRGENEDKFRGFGLGADDYMVKPFLPKELLFRIAAILRRSYKDEDPLVKLSGCEIDLERAEVIKEGERIPLTAKEYELLGALYRNAGRIVTIDALCEAAWGDNPYGYENSLMAHIRRIREKIEKNPSKPVSLVTVKGLGYKLMIERK